jgi:amidase
MTDDPFRSATELAAAIRARRVSAGELVEAHLACIARHNPVLNAICTLDEVGARRPLRVDGKASANRNATASAAAGRARRAASRRTG